ncbi:G-type lectin S-receptor-like serine/threonine-protein kinase LECRK1 [Vigna unguiculata]|uniref:G-type lectin S-receptor-like serine/threonine-protein kinase LECRK1 n=1 Tax=Vigna unguiculata TaxID=3917 RepID=UPI001016DBDE|nr:G-type lectin S-receptor-like serine/threonine-protein kinase LECRK1 [Vigna unguiculata]
MDIIAVIITCLLLMSVGTRVETQQIPVGATLAPQSTTPSFWLSPSAQFAFGFYSLEQGGGFVVAIWLVSGENKTVVWTAQRNDPPVTSGAKLQLNMDGKLVIIDDQGEEKVIAANSSAKAVSASVLDSGNFVLYNSKNDIIWQSFDYPTDTLLGGQSLPNGHQLVCSSSQNNHSSGRFRLKMQDDGNLVLYPVDTTDTGTDAYWDTETRFGLNRDEEYQYSLDRNGTLRILNESSNGRTKVILSVVSNSSLANDGNRIIYRATLNYDGIFHLYAHFKNGSTQNLKQWPQVKDMCSVKGFCGFNSYCTLDDDQPLCSCLSGFISVHQNDSTLGCKRSFLKEDCREKKDSATSYEMKSEEDIGWVDVPYFMAEMSQEECSAACLADCECEAAFYDGASCMKQRLPLRYLTRQLRDYRTSVLLWKVGDSLSNRTENDNPVPVPEPPPIKATSNKATVHIIVITSVFSLLLCSTIVISSHYTYKIRILKYKRLMETGNLGLNEEVTLRRFSYSELKRATNNFKIELGKGSFGAVYKGALEKGKRLIAVKRLEKLVEEGEREFQAEMRAIGKTRHRNLVRLLGFCAEGSKRLLVYEYMSNGSLGNLIFVGKNQRRPEWDERVRIAVEIARGIMYLHEECEAPIIHCDIKPQNILVDEFWTAKISDFGLAKLLMPDQTRTMTGARGTRGYVAPEWNKNVPISVKTDVYSYGIMLLEILCCRRNIEVHVPEPEAVSLSTWAYNCFVAGKLNKLFPWEVVDDKTAVENIVKVALWCIQDEAFLRPTMKSVVLMLEGVTDIAIPPCPASYST